MSQVYNFNGYTAGRQAYGFPSTNYGQPTAVQSSYPNPVVGQQPAGCGYGGSPQNFPQQPMVSHSPMAHSSPAIKTEPAAGTNGKSTMPAAPLGLPQRPSFDLPKYSKEDMEKFHAGHGVRISQTKPAVDNITSDHAATNPAVEQAVDASDLNQDSGDLAQGPTSANIVRGLEDLLNGSGRDDEAAKDSAFNTMSEFAEPQEEVNGGIMPGDAAIAADAQPVPASMHESQKGAPASKAKTSTMMWNNNVDSPEEVVAKSLRVKRSRSSKKRREEPVIEQADSQAVTGSVADDIEQ